MGLSIDRIETFEVIYPVAGHFKFFARPRGLPPGRPTIVVKITDHEGVVGWGQAVPSPRWSYETTETVRSTIERYLTPALIGCDPFDLDTVHRIMNREIAGAFSTGQPIAKSAIDMALYDLTGKRTGQPICRRARHETASEIALSWTINPASLDDVPAEIARAQARGYRSFNVKVAPDPASDRLLCNLVRRLAPEAFLWADANGGYDEHSAADILPTLAELDFKALEQPLPANRLTGYGRLKKLGIVPILMDESIVSHVELEEFASLGLLDGMAMKVARCGGLTEAARVMQVMHDRQLVCFASGLTDPDIALAASLAFFSAWNVSAPAALNAPQFLTTSILREPLTVDQGVLRPPHGPGLGIEVDETMLGSTALGSTAVNGQIGLPA